MSEGSSPREGTTGSTYIELGAPTKEAYEISSRSKALARETLGNRTPEDQVRHRTSVAVEDLAMAALMRFNNDPLTAGLEALKNGTPVGFVNAKGSKEVLRALDVPSISNEGTRIGTPVAIASLNEITTMFSEIEHEGPGV